MRDLGYGFNEAVADLIDNSIAAGAHHVDVTLEFEGSCSWVRISDDGCGMDASTITEAMRYGAAREYETDDLGKFGLGLKTASLSQCRRLTVASRTSKEVARAEARRLDLDYIEETDTWNILLLGAQERSEELMAPLRGHRGTVVIWEDLDRILTYQDPGGGWAKRHMLNLAGDLEAHLGMVFHRFLEGAVPRKKLTIAINGTTVDPWDPFAQDESKTECGVSQDIELSTPEGSGIVHVAPFVLPPKAGFSSETAWRRFSGPNAWNRQQGFYIYRANRMIQSGGWSGMRVADEHTKLARIALLFSPELDAAFGINIAKMRVSLPPDLRQRMEDTVSRIARRARTIYDAKPDAPKPAASRRVGTGESDGNGSRPSPPTSAAEAGVGAAGVGVVAASTTVVTYARRQALEAAADAVGERGALKKIVKKLEKRSPEVARDLGF